MDDNQKTRQGNDNNILPHEEVDDILGNAFPNSLVGANTAVIDSADKTELPELSTERDTTYLPDYESDSTIDKEIPMEPTNSDLEDVTKSKQDMENVGKDMDYSEVKRDDLDDDKIV